MKEKSLISVKYLPDTAAAEQLLREIGADERGVAIMKEKAVFRTVQVDEVPLRAAVILKETFLAKGAEAAVSRGVGALAVESGSVLLMGTLKQYRQAIAELKVQPFGLASLARELEEELFG